MKNVFKRIFKTLLISLIVTFFSIIAMFIFNRIMGVNSAIIAYILLGGLCFLMLFVGLILSRYDKIFNTKQNKKASHRQVKKHNNNTKTPQRSIQRKSHKREISYI